jgi:hypothetical protein
LANCRQRDENGSQAKDRDREFQIANLRAQVSQQQAWQRNVEAAAAAAVKQRYQQGLWDEMRALVSPRPEPAESEIIYVEADQGSDQVR